MTEDIEIITKKPTPIKSDYRESTSLSNIDETIIREAELNTLTLENDPSEIYNKSEPSRNANVILIFADMIFPCLQREKKILLIFLPELRLLLIKVF